MSYAQPLIQAGLLGEALDLGPVAVFVADEHMRYIAVNAYACDLVGYARDEMLELTMSDLAGEPAAEQFERILSGEARTGTTTLHRKDGSSFELRWIASETRVAGMPLVVCVGIPDEDPAG